MILFVISVQDIKERKIENKWILALLFCEFCKGVTLERFAGVMAVGMLFFILLMFAPGSFGGGDIKLSLVIGFGLGMKKWCYSFIVAIFSAGAVIVGKCMLGKIKKNDEIAFGPYLCLGAVMVKVFM